MVRERQCSNTQPQRSEVYVPAAVDDRADSDDLAGERLAARPLDGTVRAHAALLETVAVAWGGSVSSCRGEISWTSAGVFILSASCGRSRCKSAETERTPCCGRIQLRGAQLRDLATGRSRREWMTAHVSFTTASMTSIWLRVSDRRTLEAHAHAIVGDVQNATLVEVRDDGHVLMATRNDVPSTPTRFTRMPAR
jgi:hypothetical protein